MVLKNDGREPSKKKRHKLIKCDACRHMNDYDVMLENDDVDFVGGKSYIYCEQCGNNIQAKV